MRKPITVFASSSAVASWMGVSALISSAMGVSPLNTGTIFALLPLSASSHSAGHMTTPIS